MGGHPVYLGWSGGRGDPSGRSQSPCRGLGNLTWEVEEEFYHFFHRAGSVTPPNPASTWHQVPCGGVSGVGAEVRQRSPSSVTDTGGNKGGDVGDTVDVTRLPWLSCVSGVGGSTGREQNTEPLLGTAVFGVFFLPSCLLEWGTWTWSPQGSSKLRLGNKSWGCQCCHQGPHD